MFSYSPSTILRPPCSSLRNTASQSPSNKILRRVIAAGWIEEERRSDYRHLLLLEPAALILIEALRNIVSQNVASFTGKLRLVCDRLSALRNPHSRMELIWEQLRHCLNEVRTGLRELRSIRKQVERYARRQLTTTTIAEALDIIYNEFSALITQQCYRELIHARLPERLREAMEGLRELEQDDLALQSLRDDYARTHPDAAHALAEILRTIEAISLGLGDVEPTADEEWRPALELAFTRKFAIVVASEDHAEALRIYKELGPTARRNRSSIPSAPSPASRKVATIRSLHMHFRPATPPMAPLTASDLATIDRLLASSLLDPTEKKHLIAMRNAGHKGRFEQENLGIPQPVWPFYDIVPEVPRSC